MRRKFLTAEWRNLVMINYEVAPKVWIRLCLLEPN